MRTLRYACMLPFLTFGLLTNLFSLNISGVRMLTAMDHAYLLTVRGRGFGLITKVTDVPGSVLKTCMLCTQMRLRDSWGGRGRHGTIETLQPFSCRGKEQLLGNRSKGREIVICTKAHVRLFQNILSACHTRKMISANRFT
jgi:hypothetical protein